MFIRGWVPERPKGADCKSAVTDFDGSNPSPSTIFCSAGMAELADAHGSGPCVGDNMQVQVLFPAPNQRTNFDRKIASHFGELSFVYARKTRYLWAFRTFSISGANHGGSDFPSCLRAKILDDVFSLFLNTLYITKRNA